MTSPAELFGPGFDDNGGTGWLVTSVPVTPGETITLVASIYDGADGRLASAGLLDHFECLADDPSGPWTSRANGDGEPTDPAPPSLSLLSVTPDEIVENEATVVEVVEVVGTWLTDAEWQLSGDGEPLVPEVVGSTVPGPTGEQSFSLQLPALAPGVYALEASH